jgi:small subunit ribosomal protein S6
MADKPNYDLMVLLDPEAPEERRAQLIEQIRAQIESGDATLKGDADWGMRRLAYEIDHRVEAQYHLFQFEASPDVLSGLDRSLSIEDAVLRFRTIRLPGEAPEQTPQAPPQTSFESGRREGREGRGRDGRDDRGERRGPETRTEDAPADGEVVEAPAAEAPAEAAPEAPAEAAPEAPAEAPAEAATEAAPEAAAVAPEATEAPASEQPSQGEPPPENS